MAKNMFDGWRMTCDGCGYSGQRAASETQKISALLMFHMMRHIMESHAGRNETFTVEKPADADSD